MIKEGAFYLIFSYEHAHGHICWWKSHFCGYTTSFLSAGRYTKEEVTTIVNSAQPGDEEAVLYGGKKFRELIKNGDATQFEMFEKIEELRNLVFNLSSCPYPLHDHIPEKQWEKVCHIYNDLAAEDKVRSSGVDNIVHKRKG